MSERRYSEDEVKEIFRKATDTRPDPQGMTRPGLDSSAGMTLAELQDIGREAGIAPEAVAYAAALRDNAVPTVPRRFLGLQIGVGKTVELSRPLTDLEWERLVVVLRETFDARGNVTGHGSIRQWTNGNLQIMLEPTATAQRLRMKTVKGNVQAQMMAGIGVAAFGIVPAIVAMVTGYGGPEALGAAGPMVLIGAGLIGAAAARLPSWARTRSQQMDSVAANAAEIAAAPVLTPGHADTENL